MRDSIKSIVLNDTKAFLKTQFQKKGFSKTSKLLSYSAEFLEENFTKINPKDSYSILLMIASPEEIINDWYGPMTSKIIELASLRN